VTEQTAERPKVLSAAGIDPGLALAKGTMVCTVGPEGVTFTRCTDSSDGLLHRLRAIRSEATAALGGDSLPVAIERPSGVRGYGQQLHGLYWMLLDAIYSPARPCFSVAPSTLKKFISDKGNADKAQIATAAVRHWGSLIPGRDLDADQADALGLAMLAACAAGQPCPCGDWTQYQLAAAQKAVRL